MAQTKTKRKKKRSTGQPISAAMLLLIFLASLMLLLLLFWMVFHRDDSPSEQDSVESPVATQTLPPSELAAECFGTSNGYKTYTSPTILGTLGIDVSEHQGSIDWAVVAASDVDYAIIRAGYRGYTDGTTNEDLSFRYNIEGALENGLEVGIYFFSQALNEEEAIAEAKTVLELISGYDIQYPIYYDWEPIDNDTARTDTISGTELTNCALAFCQTIEDAGYQAGVYFNLSLAAHLYHLYDLRDYDFWLAEYQDTPSFPFAIHMWQYTSEGTVPGISTTVDLNLSFQKTT